MRNAYLQAIAPLPAALATAVAMAGLLLVHRAWRRRDARLRFAGWLLEAGAFWLWGRAAGVEMGAALGGVTVPLAALAIIAAHGQWARRTAPLGGGRRVPPADSPVRATQGPAPGRGRRTLLRLLGAGPLGALAAASLAMALMASTWGAAADQLMMAAIATLLLWAVGIVWSCADPRPARPVLGLAGVALVCLPPLALAA